MQLRRPLELQYGRLSNSQQFGSGHIIECVYYTSSVYESVTPSRTRTLCHWHMRFVNTMRRAMKGTQRSNMLTVIPFVRPEEYFRHASYRCRCR